MVYHHDASDLFISDILSGDTRRDDDAILFLILVRIKGEFHGVGHNCQFRLEAMVVLCRCALLKDVYSDAVRT